MPKYTMLIYSPAEGGPSPEQLAAQFPKWGAYTERLQQAGVYVAGEGLQPADVATTVRVRDGETQITDGPFAETKEVLGGFYVIDVPDLDTALEHAAHMPNIAYGSVEVRPIIDVEAMMAETQAQATA